MTKQFFFCYFEPGALTVIGHKCEGYFVFKQPGNEFIGAFDQGLSAIYNPIHINQ